MTRETFRDTCEVGTCDEKTGETKLIGALSENMEEVSSERVVGYMSSLLEEGVNPGDKTKKSDEIKKLL